MPAKKSDQNDSEADDLISLCSAIDLESKVSVGLPYVIGLVQL